MNIGIINSGGDAQGLNAVIAAVVHYGLKSDYKFFGFLRGWEGLLDMSFIELNADNVRGISHLGGTILHTVNKGRFSGKVGLGELNKIPLDILQLAKSNLVKMNIDALVVIGGDGTLSGAMQLADLGVNIIGVPKTIDNDLKYTDQTFGFNTVVSIVVDALDKLHTTAASHDRVMIVETMGRHVGWIGLYSGLAGGAHIILIPEITFDYERLVEYLRKRKSTGNNYTIIVVSEGAKALDNISVVNDMQSNSSEVKLGGVSEQIIYNIEKLAPQEFELRNVILGHVQRGGSPNAEDRILAKAYGVAAIDAIQAQKFGHMVCIVNGQISTVPITDAVESLKVVTKDSLAYQTAIKTGIYFGD